MQTMGGNYSIFKFSFPISKSMTRGTEVSIKHCLISLAA